MVAQGAEMEEAWRVVVETAVQAMGLKAMVMETVSAVREVR